MKVGRKRKKKAEIPTASMSDIAFLLIIFFMATTKFDVKEGVRVQLNKAVEQEQAKTTEIKLTENEMTRIEITQDGMLRINNAPARPFNDEELKKLILDKIELRERLNRESTIAEEKDLKMLFLVKTDTEAKYSYMVRVVDFLVPHKDRAQISISTQI